MPKKKKKKKKKSKPKVRKVSQLEVKLAPIANESTAEALVAGYHCLGGWLQIADYEDRRGGDDHAMALMATEFKRITGQDIREAECPETPEHYLYKHEIEEEDSDEEE